MIKIRFVVLARKAKHGMLDIYIRCTQGKNVKDIRTNYRVYQDEWDESESLVKNNPNATSINKAIRKIIYEMESLEFSHEDGVNLHQFVRLWKFKDVSEDFYQCIERELPNRSVRPSTLLLHKHTFILLKEYCPHCCVEDLNESFVMGFYNFLEKKICFRGHRFNSSTINKHMMIFRVYYNIARKMFGKKVPSGSFDFFRPKSKRNEAVKALNDDEIRKLELFLAKGKAKPKDLFAVEQFLMMSYTGMRISDYTSITKDNIVFKDGLTWIEYTSVKTNVKVKLPVASLFDGRAEQILYKYLDNIETLFTIRWQTAFNKRIKRIATECGISKNVSSHVARHTFATRLLNKGVPIQTIQKVVGHQRMDTTMGYARITDESIVRQLSAV